MGLERTNVRIIMGAVESPRTDCAAGGMAETCIGGSDVVETTQILEAAC